ncbi:MAG: hypothetical protein IT456_15960 [Planctomycetes bacterium]|jgi:hypothetical protein|nr:hypothetical protein [Planctomycetota bacterium]
MKKVQSLAAMLFAAMFSPSVTINAQDNCPFERTQHIEANIQHGPAQNCGGVNYQVGGVSVTTARDGCPLYAIYTPPHDVAVRSTNRTSVQVVSLQPITKVIFECRDDWFLIFPIGSTCVYSRQVNLGSVPLCLSQPCPERAQA